MIQVANAPCSWGVIENVEGQRGAYARVLDEMQEAGYAGTELGDWGFMPTDPRVLRRELESRKLKLLASWVTVHLHDSARLPANEADVLRTARQLAEVGGPDNLVVLGNDPYTDGANRLARTVKRETGLRTVFHHHIGTWVETPEETARFLAMTDPEVLGLCFDTGHYSFGGGNAVEGVRRHADRIWHVHFKDHDPKVAARSRREGWNAVKTIEQGVFCELGNGDVDFKAILGELGRRGYGGWIVVEQDVIPGMGNPKESAKRNREYLKRIGL